MGYRDVRRPSSVVRRASCVVRRASCGVNFFLLRASTPKLLEGFQPNYTGMILGWSPLKIVEMVLVCWLTRSQELKID